MIVVACALLLASAVLCKEDSWEEDTVTPATLSADTVTMSICLKQPCACKPHLSPETARLLPLCRSLSAALQVSNWTRKKSKTRNQLDQRGGALKITQAKIKLNM